MNKLISHPSGAAGEYSYYAMSFYEGCVENKCTYCYMSAMSKRFKSYFGIARLKPWLINEDNALKIFIKEVDKIIPQLQKYGLFFNFSSDPCLQQSIKLNILAWDYLVQKGINIKILTKQVNWIDTGDWKIEGIFPTFIKDKYKKHFAFGFTLTGRNELEPGCSTNAERIQSMKLLHEKGFKTFGSFEPIINLNDTYDMIIKCSEYCDLFKIGLMSGAKYSKSELNTFISTVVIVLENKKIYFKDSLLKTAGIERKDLPLNCVNRDYNIFKV